MPLSDMTFGQLMTQYYDYRRLGVGSRLYDARRALVRRLNLRGDEHILDVGCGDGKVTAEIARAVPRGAVTILRTWPKA